MDGLATGKPVRGLITSTYGVGSVTGCVGVVCSSIPTGVVLVDGFEGGAVPVGRLGLQLLSSKDIKMTQMRGKRLMERGMVDKGDGHLLLRKPFLMRS
jgi:hypothetical protein